jgi:hypothetical protein
MHKGPRLPTACLLVPVYMIIPRYLTAVLEQELSRPLKLNPLVAMKRPSWDARAKNPSALNFTACALGRPSFVVPTVDVLCATTLLISKRNARKLCVPSCLEILPRLTQSLKN